MHKHRERQRGMDSVRETLRGEDGGSFHPGLTGPLAIQASKWFDLVTRADEKENVILLKGSAPEAPGSLFPSLETCRGIMDDSQEKDFRCAACWCTCTICWTLKQSSEVRVGSFTDRPLSSYCEESMEENLRSGSIFLVHSWLVDPEWISKVLQDRARTQLSLAAA